MRRKKNIRLKTESVQSLSVLIHSICYKLHFSIFIFFTRSIFLLLLVFFGLCMVFSLSGVCATRFSILTRCVCFAFAHVRCNSDLYTKRMQKESIVAHLLACCVALCFLPGSSFYLQFYLFIYFSSFFFSSYCKLFVLRLCQSTIIIAPHTQTHKHTNTSVWKGFYPCIKLV